MLIISLPREGWADKRTMAGTPYDAGGEAGEAGNGKNAPHPPLRGTVSLMEKEYNHPLSLGERVAEDRVRGYGRGLDAVHIC